MNSKRESDQRKERVEALVEAFSEAWFSGRAPDVDEFCRGHPEYGQELRRRIEIFLFVAEGFTVWRNDEEKNHDESE